MADPFADRLVAYIEACGHRGFGAQARGAEPALLRELESLLGAPLPPEYRDYLERLGGDAAGFKLFADDEGGFLDVLDYYRGAAQGPGFVPPPRGSVLIAAGFHDNLALDGRSPLRRPVALWSGGSFGDELADSLEQHCFQCAWGLYDAGRWEASHRVTLEEAGPAAAQLGVEAARRAGLDLQPFSDSRTRMLSGDASAASIQTTEDGGLSVGAHARGEDAARVLAESIAGAMRGGR